MKLAILSESPADEAALRVLVEGALGEPVQLVQASLRARGWPSVAQVMPAIIRHLHFNTDADGLAVVVDADDSVVHTEPHEAPGYFHPHCRLCQLRAVYRQTVKKLPPARGRQRILRAVGVAVPAIEGWYLCGRDQTVSEAAWLHGQEIGQAPYTRHELKWRVYATDRPSLPHETLCALEDARRHAQDTRRLENDFPGFRALANDLRTWRHLPKSG
jgi:predicted acyl esterase